MLVVVVMVMVVIRVIVMVVIVMLAIVILMMVMVMGLNCHPTPPGQVVLEQVYWKEKSKDEEGVEGDGKALTRKQNLEHTRQDQEKVPTI